MNTRKIVLLGAIVVLGGLLGLEFLMADRSSVTALVLKDKPDSLRIEKGDGSIVLLNLRNDAWVAGDQGYKTDASKMDAMIKALSTVRRLDKVSSGGDDERYGFQAPDRLTVIAKSGAKELRRIEIGKTSSSTRQTYVRLDGGKDVLLVAGNLKQTFGLTLEALRDKVVFTMKAADVTAVRSEGSGAYSLVKGPDGSWSASGAAATKLDTAKVNSFLSGIERVQAASFAPEAVELPPVSLATLTITAGPATLTMTIYPKGEGDRYLCVSSESPYPFYLSSYEAERFLKSLSDLESK